MELNQICTIASLDYLPQVEVLKNSLDRHCPTFQLAILLVDVEFKKPEKIGNVTLYSPSMLLDDSVIRKLKERYDIVEFATALKPYLLKFLLQESERVIYLDPDIRVYSSLQEIFLTLLENPIILTPHKLRVKSGAVGNLQDLNRLKYGIFNLGFIGVSKEGKPMLDWWAERTTFLSTRYHGDSVFTDQKWIDLLPSYFQFKILNNLGCNVGPWNIDERQLSKVAGEIFVDDKRLIFFHFSQFNFFLKNQGVNPATLNEYLSDMAHHVSDTLFELYFQYWTEIIKSRDFQREIIKLDYCEVRFSKPKKPLYNIIKRYQWKFGKSWILNSLFKVGSRSSAFSGGVIGLYSDFDRFLKMIERRRKGM